MSDQAGGSAVQDRRLPFREFVATEPTLSQDERDLLISIYDSWQE